MHQPRRPFRSGLAAILLSCFVAGFCLLPSQAEGPPAERTGSPNACDFAEPCYLAAVALREQATSVEAPDQIVEEALAHLRLVQERHPSTPWAKRARLLIGISLIDRDPPEALRILRDVEQDFPELVDYIRFWMAEALLASGERVQAAELFGSVADAAAEPSLAVKSTFKTGEAFYLADQCQRAMPWLHRALSANDHGTEAPSSLLHLAECQLREHQPTTARSLLKQVWVRFPQSKEAGKAEAALLTNIDGTVWAPEAEDRLLRAQAFLGLAMHAQAIQELRRFLAMAPSDPRRFEAKLKHGIAHARLKQYDQAKDVFRALSDESVPESQEALVWLARVYLRQGQGDPLLEMEKGLVKSKLSKEQQAMIHLFAGIWYEDQQQFDLAIDHYRQVTSVAESDAQRADGMWRVGWVQYRDGRYTEAIETFRELITNSSEDVAPQALYWTARAYEQVNNPAAQETYRRVCETSAHGYYCQLARRRAESLLLPDHLTSPSALGGDEAAADSKRREIEQHPAYRRALELKTLGMRSETTRELAGLTEQYRQDRDLLLTLSGLLHDVGAYHAALRLAKIYFRDMLENGAGVPTLWRVAYPTGLLPVIRAQGVSGVDPYLAAAIIREESQYDEQAVSRVGAIGLMQLMPATAEAVAKQFGFPTVVREHLFHQETNIRIGVHYLKQLLDQFAGNITYAVAAYNAGPMAVNQWITSHRGRDEDEFVELIPYFETRQYAKRVLRSYREYHRLGRDDL